ncbi:uncharacterized protein LOC103702385 [Phoenix dactylifera]|uniref:Uncharacterized protein LOC103702385 n=1 Tax=Phoenix dactylifera TaxID=42345 RepID=A0A8B9ADN7_PHODC|nr:uncharacterized protein LOC103702385 [Phoenix dactylifera]
MASPARSSPVAFSGIASFTGGDSSLLPDPNSQTGSAAGSFQGEGLLAGTAGGVPEVDGGSGGEAEFGFQRPEFGQEALAGTVQIYDRHVFLCYKSPNVWPSHVEAAESDRLPRLLFAALKARKEDMKKRTRMTICEGEDGTDSSNGDVLIFPDMIRYRKLTHFDVDTFVEEVLVKDNEWLPGAAEPLTGSFVFICAHQSRDRRCGVCGPALVKKFKEEITLYGLQRQVSVRPCSHVGGHKYAGNVIIFSPNINGELTGHWYGYVSPDDVPTLLEQHIRKGKIVDHLWRGQMGLSEEDQKNAQNLRLQPNSGMEQNTAKEFIETAGTDGVVNGTIAGAGGCCQGTGNISCCQNTPPMEKPENDQIGEQKTQEVEQEKSKMETKTSSNKAASCTRKICAMPTWFESWEREDTYAALAVVAAIASVAVAYSCYRQLR